MISRNVCMSIAIRAKQNRSEHGYVGGVFDSVNDDHVAAVGKCRLGLKSYTIPWRE